MLDKNKDSLLKSVTVFYFDLDKKIPSTFVVTEKTWFHHKSTVNMICDRNHTSLSPCRLSMVSGLVFTSDQVCPEKYVVIYHKFSVYSHVFWVCPKVWHGHKHQDQNKGIMD